MFWANFFFRRPLEKFLCAWQTCSRYQKDHSNLILNWTHTETWYAFSNLTGHLGDFRQYGSKRLDFVTIVSGSINLPRVTGLGFFIGPLENFLELIFWKKFFEKMEVFFGLKKISKVGFSIASKMTFWIQKTNRVIFASF